MGDFELFAEAIESLYSLCDAYNDVHEELLEAVEEDDLEACEELNDALDDALDTIIALCEDIGVDVSSLPLDEFHTEEV